MGPGARRDRSGGNVGLLRRKPALFDRKPRRIARGPDSLEPVDVHGSVGLHESVLPLREPRERRYLKRRQRDRRVHGDRPIGLQVQLPFLETVHEA